MKIREGILAAAVAMASLSAVQSTQAAVIFDNFNSGVGTHFNASPNASGTTNILKPVATTPNANAVAVTAVDPFEGAQSLKITIEGGGQTNASPSFPRIRFTSGAGTPANNTSFSVDPIATDGWIGFYYKIPVPGSLPGSLPSGLQLQLNLDAGANAAGDADSGIAQNAIMDGEWHLVEWNLDNAADWVAMPGVGGDGNLTPGGLTTSHTIDSIYFRYPIGTTWTGYTGTQDLLIDFVAKSDSGSIATLIPEPTTASLLLLGGAALALRRRRA